VSEQAKQQELETWATNHIRQWSRKLQTDDYDFRSWAQGANKKCMRAGAVYEYARESRKLRCLLALMNPKRLREQWEHSLPALIEGKKPGPDEIASFPAEMYCEPYSFEDLEERAAERALGGFLYCLLHLADYLADNISFGALFHTKPDELENAFGGLDTLSRVKRAFGHLMPIENAVEVAAQSEVEHATVEESLDEKSAEKRVILGDTCSEVIVLKIRWRFTNSEIARAIRKLVRSMRPGTCKPIERKKGSRQDSPRSALDALSAMRLASYVQKTSAASAEALSSYLSGNLEGIRFEPSAIRLFERVRLGGRGKHIAESNFDALVNYARKAFKESFPFGEDAANTLIFKDRVMMESEQVSSQDKV
jgi:hypothetical protein